ncbi:hypothetical protein CPLU01_07088 [Colletotrichum plurivorum]|uniref:Uncharacterized protein n=1 Tax=Colletotrichum plurivorum TaxID=2175906 RepID=A0A8H6NEX9_9PEZI|nr:hypothetical protein CPLU01_07088 [Colletotrichum plurivorum]
MGIPLAVSAESPKVPKCHIPHVTPKRAAVITPHKGARGPGPAPDVAPPQDTDTGPSLSGCHFPHSERRIGFLGTVLSLAGILLVMRKMIFVRWNLEKERKISSRLKSPRLYCGPSTWVIALAL